MKGATKDKHDAESEHKPGMSALGFQQSDQNEGNGHIFNKVAMSADRTTKACATAIAQAGFGGSAPTHNIDGKANVEERQNAGGK